MNVYILLTICICIFFFCIKWVFYLSIHSILIYYLNFSDLKILWEAVQLLSEGPLSRQCQSPKDKVAWPWCKYSDRTIVLERYFLSIVDGDLRISWVLSLILDPSMSVYEIAEPSRFHPGWEILVTKRAYPWGDARQWFSECSQLQSGIRSQVRLDICGRVGYHLVLS
jgi:hypothetical protein